ncbi:S-layer homology domain-containing protein [Paenibacillus sp. FSL H8-0034]|uniref:S-layer homology domain-containing protein n=1 Tax=Paenibacillus sp. FSL H8-0034 TaxID=2954671 RepID=UPI0030FBFFC3
MRAKWKNKGCMSLLLVLFIMFNLITPAFVSAAVDARGTYFTDFDNWNGDLAGTGAADGDFDSATYGNGDAKYPIEFKITNVDKVPQKSAQFLVRAYDVDEYDGSSNTGEWDRVYLSSNPADIQLGAPYTVWPTSSMWNAKSAEYKKEFKKETYLGALSGNNETWNTSVFSVDPAKITADKQEYFAGISVHHNPKASTSTINSWVVKVDWGQLVIDGGERVTGEITKGEYKIVNGVMQVDTGFLPKTNGDFAMEVSLIKKVKEADGTVSDDNVATTTKRYLNSTANNGQSWTGIELGSGLDPNDEYIVNIILFDDRGGAGTDINPGKAQHVYSVSTDSAMAKIGPQYTPTVFTAEDFKSKFYKLNGSPNGDGLTKVQIKTLPDPTKGQLVLDNGVNNPPTIIAVNDEIDVADLSRFQFVSLTGEFTTPVTFTWTGFDTDYALFNAVVTITPNKAPTVDNITKSVNKGSNVNFNSSDFTGTKFVDPEPDALNDVIFVTLPDPAKGTLVLDNGGGTPVSVAVYTKIPEANLNQLKFIPASGTTGVVTFGWNGSDGIQYAQEPKVVTMLINDPPIIADITKTGLAGAVIHFMDDDFALAPAYTDSDGDALVNVKLTLPSDFDTKGKLWYTNVSTAVYINQGSSVTLTKAQLNSLKFQPSSNLPNGSTVTFNWTANDGKADSIAPALVKIAYNGKPVAQPLEFNVEEGTSPITIILKGSDMESVTGLVYGIATQPTKGTLVQVNGDQWMYTPNAGATGKDSFTYTVTDADTQKSQPATVQIEVNKLLDGWVGNKAQGDTTVVKLIAGQLLKLSAVSSLQAAEVTASVNGVLVPLTLANPTTYLTEGFKRWETSTYTLPEGTTPGEYTVNFTAKGTDQALLPAEPVSKLGDNKFKIAEYAIIKLKADPEKILGNGKATTNLSALVTDADGNPMADTEVVFSTPTGAGSFVGPDRARTNSQGIATVIYQSEKIVGTDEKQIPIKAVVHDTEKGLSGQGQITVTFLPPTISGVITKGGTHEAVAGASIRVTLDMNGDGKIEPGVDFDKTITTKADGSYSIPVPEGDKEYNLEVTQTVIVGGVETPVTYTQKAIVGSVTGTGNETFDSEKTVTGVVLFKKPDGNSSFFSPDLVSKIKVYLKDPAGNYIMEEGKPKGFELQGQGLFQAKGLTKGITYSMEISYELEPGKEIVMKRNTVTVNADGEMNIVQELVDPYGTITDAGTHNVIEGAQVVLYYADTERNKNKGITPNTTVTLPTVAGFAPNDNKSPDQLSDAAGFYAYMVYPQTDYYLVVTKAGYRTQTSETISVEFDIVKKDFALLRNQNSSSGSSGGGSVSIQPDVTLNISVDKNLVKEGDQSTVTVDYKNQALTTLGSGEISVTIPKGAELVNANGGTVSGDVITWKVSNLASGQTGSFTFEVKWPLLTAADAEFEFPGQFTADGSTTNPVKANSTVKIKVFSDRFGTLMHQRYILGYPDGQFKPNNSLTRAEVAAIVARLTENVNITDALSYSDIEDGHWAANYVKIATKHGYFSGFEDGSFKPEAPVTRGELAAIMARFLKLNVSKPGENHFSDVEGHWAADAIEELYRAHFLSGYSDGTFKPQDKINRVEAVTMINRMLYRGPLQGVEPLFPDVPASHWGFGDVLESTFSHESVRNEDGSETWKDNIADNVQ